MPDSRPTSRRRLLWYAGALILVTALATVYYFIDPSSRFMPRCVFRQLTGWSCPGCGSQRFVHALLNGNVAEAVSYNYFIPFGIAIICVSAWLDVTRRRHPERYRKAMRPMFLYVILGLVVVWTVVRNLFGL